MPWIRDGDVHKLMKMSLPYRNGRTVLWMGQRAHDNNELYDPLERALSSGRLDTRDLLDTGHTRPSCRTNQDFYFDWDPKPVPGAPHMGKSHNVVEHGDCLWTITLSNSSCPRTGRCGMPQYYRNGYPVDPSRASSALRNAQFEEESALQEHFAYDALNVEPRGGCRDSPGPASDTLYCSKTLDNTWVGYRWYKFVDQPGLVQQRLTQTQKNFMQARIETLHKMVPSSVSKWINGRNAEAEGMARMDPAAITEPPDGLKIGYVPIILYQGTEQPQNCHSHPPPAPVPPPPSPRPTPSPSPSGRCSNIPNWKNQDGDTCNTYNRYAYCTSTGAEGKGWNRAAWGRIENYHDRKGNTAADACCSCGGGNYGVVV